MTSPFQSLPDFLHFRRNKYEATKIYNKLGGGNDDIDQLQDIPTIQPRHYKTVYTIMSLCNVLIFVSTVFIWLQPTFRLNIRGYYKEKNAVLKESSFYSPILDRLDLPSRPTKLNGTLIDSASPPTIWRQSPSSEVDAAWDHISTLGFHLISSNDVSLLGKDPSNTVRVPSNWGYGNDAHIAVPDVSHQIHCLNMLRKHIFPDYYPQERHAMAFVHPMHCVHMLLQNLMCDSSVDLVTYNWVETQKHPFPDMSINRECRSFDTLLQWQEENALQFGINGKVDGMIRPEGATELRASKEFLALVEEIKDENRQGGKGDGI